MKYENVILELTLLIAVLSLIISIFMSDHTARRVNETWTRELVKRGIMSKTKHGFVFNKIFVVKVRKDED